MFLAGVHGGFRVLDQLDRRTAVIGINTDAQARGVMGDYFKARGNPVESDLGRYLLTQDEEDRHVFKVPSLRNVAVTAPYFHDASAKTLEEAVDVMFKYQLGRIPSAEDKDLIIHFLKTLTGEWAGKPL
jgi:cytochrome c peroxidase